MKTSATRSEGSLEEIIRASLGEFADFLSGSSWWGREREMVSLYAFGFLQRHCKHGSVLHDPTQIGIEAAVPQLPRPGAKSHVCKDLVIWPEPKMTCWAGCGHPPCYPLAILEWKTTKSGGRQADIDWLSEYSAAHPESVGFSVLCGVAPRVSLDVTLARSGHVDHEWLVRR